MRRWTSRLGPDVWWHVSPDRLLTVGFRLRRPDRTAELVAAVIDVCRELTAMVSDVRMIKNDLLAVREQMTIDAEIAAAEADLAADGDGER